jgi:hypothetical protein
MAKTLQFRRGTTANLASITGAVGELFVDTDKDTIVVMDGITAGGFRVATEPNLFNTSSTDLSGPTAIYWSSEFSQLRFNTTDTGWKAAAQAAAITADKFVITTASATYEYDNANYPVNSTISGPFSGPFYGFAWNGWNPSGWIGSAPPDNSVTSITGFSAVTPSQIDNALSNTNSKLASAYNTANNAYDAANSVSSGYLANTVITANSSGYLGNTSNLIFKSEAPGTGGALYPELKVVDSQSSNYNVATIRPDLLDIRTGTNFLTDTQTVIQSYNFSLKEKYHGGLNGGGASAYGGRSRYEVRQLYANTTNATMVFASYTGTQATPQDYAGSVANGEVSIFETTIIAQSQGAPGANTFDGTKIWKYETTYSKTPTISLSDTISTQVSNTGNSGTWVANLYFNTSYSSGDGINIAVQGQAGKNIFWYVTHTQKSLWCTFAGGGGGGK